LDCRTFFPTEIFVIIIWEIKGFGDCPVAEFIEQDHPMAICVTLFPLSFDVTDIDAPVPHHLLSGLKFFETDSPVTI
jgi:hypothetical protein